MKCTVVAILVMLAVAFPCRADDLYPKHINAETQRSIQRGLDYLAKTQAQDGNWSSSGDGEAYPTVVTALAGMAFLANGNTPSRGPYAENVQKAVLYLLSNVRPSGLITDSSEGLGRPMYGHGFALLFLASTYGMETDIRTRDAMKKAINGAIDLTAKGQSAAGGWTYTPGGGDEGSVTVTQMQGLRAASNAGFSVPKGTIEAAVQYLETLQNARRRHLLFPRLRRRPAPRHQRRRHRHALQRRRIRFAPRRRLPRVCLEPFRSKQKQLVQRRRPRLLHAPLRQPGLLPGRRQILGRLLPPHARPVDSPCNKPTAPGTATASARSTARASRRSSCSCRINFYRFTNDKFERACKRA